LIEAGELARARPAASEAEQVARTITNPNSPAEALASLTTAFAKAGELKRAEQVARTITNPNSQAHALASLTTTLAEAGELERARMVVASALAVTNWGRSLWRN
jgi:hypothetical protein